MSKLKDLTGEKFGRLTVLKRYGSNKKGQAMWMCECECGNINIVNGSNLRTGHVMSCGCLNKELAKERFIRHNLRHTKIYNVWRDMKYRCENKNNPQYKDYGGRGISVCDEWHDFNKFYNWAIEYGYFLVYSDDSCKTYGLIRDYSDENKDGCETIVDHMTWHEAVSVIKAMYSIMQHECLGED